MRGAYRWYRPRECASPPSSCSRLRARPARSSSDESIRVRTGSSSEPWIRTARRPSKPDGCSPPRTSCSTNRRTTRRAGSRASSSRVPASASALRSWSRTLLPDRTQRPAKCTGTWGSSSPASGRGPRTRLRPRGRAWSWSISRGFAAPISFGDRPIFSCTPGERSTRNGSNVPVAGPSNYRGRDASAQTPLSVEAHAMHGPGARGSRGRGPSGVPSTDPSIASSILRPQGSPPHQRTTRIWVDPASSARVSAYAKDARKRSVACSVSARSKSARRRSTSASTCSSGKVDLRPSRSVADTVPCSASRRPISRRSGAPRSSQK